MNRHDRIANDWLREMSSRFAREFPKPCPVCEGKGEARGVYPWIDPYHEITLICEHCNGTGAER